MKVWSFASFTEHALSLKARMLKQKKNTSDPDNLLIGIHPSWAVDSSQRSISTGEEVQRRIPSLCSCGHVYIGETKKALETRIKEHKAATRRGEIEKSAIAEASQNLLSALLIHDYLHDFNHGRMLVDMGPPSTHSIIPFDSKFNFTPCRLHPASNGNSISESHPEYEGHAHHYIITLRHPADQMEARALYRALRAIRRPHAGRHLALAIFVHPT